MLPEALYRPVFAGTSGTGEKVLLYIDREDHFHIKVDDGKLTALNPDRTTLEWWYDRIADKTFLTVQSLVWSGSAEGTKKEFMEAETLYGT